MGDCGHSPEDWRGWLGAGAGGLGSQKDLLRGRVWGTRERDSQCLAWLLGKWGHLTLKKGFGSSRSGSAMDRSVVSE